MCLRSRLIPLIIIAILTLTASVGNADMYCSNGGYIYWLNGLPYCVMSAMSHECLACTVTGNSPDDLTYSLGEP
jgi:hypothetical protein